MEWLAENAHNGYFLLAFAAAMLVGVWWIQRQIVYLAGAGVALGLLLVFWLVIRNVPTTAKRIEADLNCLAQALLAKDQDKAFRYVAEEMKYKAKHRDKWYAALGEMIDDSKIDAIAVKRFELKSRDGDEANVVFHLEARHKGKSLYSAECPWMMTRDGEVWQVSKVSLRLEQARACSKGLPGLPDTSTPRKPPRHRRVPSAASRCAVSCRRRTLAPLRDNRSYLRLTPGRRHPHLRFRPQQSRARGQGD